MERDVDHDRHEERQRDEDGERHRLFALEHVQLLRHKLLDRHRQPVHDGLRARQVLEQVTEMFRLSFLEEVLSPAKWRVPGGVIPHSAAWKVHATMESNFCRALHII